LIADGGFFGERHVPVAPGGILPTSFQSGAQAIRLWLLQEFPENAYDPIRVPPDHLLPSKNSKREVTGSPQAEIFASLLILFAV
jgi:hypothetical protein